MDADHKSDCTDAIFAASLLTAAFALRFPGQPILIRTSSPRLSFVARRKEAQFTWPPD
jgi:hypothetical protein